MTDESLRYRSAPQRRAEILDCLQHVGFMTTAELASRLGVSEMTIRRDAHLLHKRGEVISSRGALRLPNWADVPGGGDLGDDYANRARTATSGKMVIGKLAAADVRNDDIIAVDAGTTACQVVRALPPEFVGTVVTHSIPAINLLLDRPHIKSIALGGDIHAPSRALVGSTTVENVRRLKVRSFYLGAAAVDERGVYASADVEKQVKNTLMSISDRIVLLIDHRKFDLTAPVLLCGWDSINSIVTDKKVSHDFSDLFARTGINVVTP
ncbi:DeoR/GlpR family DNA-binding transcription regulator [Pleomorphomonas sp. JP5]|uniref:DeoR/GlpR family DNA-binding transcription regulator n=1 Tax=Pleomorphomonas sp. JP5 TaxID=2942998 RepID=UPI00211E4538|nr:DeoR/GlpR family DNA-binding transcription regulator [Pleomorphomonas sp. JP5]